MNKVSSNSLQCVASTLRSAIKRSLSASFTMDVEDAEHVADLAQSLAITLRAVKQTYREELLRGQAEPTDTEEENSPLS